MITLNSYIITEHAVLQGVNQGVQQLLKDIENFKKPEIVIEKIASSVMGELCDIMDFGQQPIRFTPDLLRKMYVLSQEEVTQPPPPQSDLLN
jgi:hypothetical protein